MAVLRGTWRSEFSMVSMILPGVVVKIAHGYCLERHLFMEQGVVERLLSDNEEAEDNGQIIRE